MKYLKIRQEVKKCEERCDGSCLDADYFYICDPCKERHNLEYRMERLMNLWGDTWAVQLANLQNH